MRLSRQSPIFHFRDSRMTSSLARCPKSSSVTPASRTVFVRRSVTDPNVAPMHRWRDRFKTVGMEAGIPTRILDAIQGHAPRTAGDSYGEVTVKAMAQAMERVPRVEV